MPSTLTIKITYGAQQFVGTVPRVSNVVAQAATLESLRIQLHTMIDSWCPEYAGLPFREIYDVPRALQVHIRHAETATRQLRKRGWPDAAIAAAMVKAAD